MLKISQKMGGLPSELQPVLKKCPAFFRWCMRVTGFVLFHIHVHGPGLTRQR